MINNTNHAKWDRINAKSLDSMFIKEMLEGLNCSMFEAQCILGKMHEIFMPFFEASQSIKSGQIKKLIIDASVSPNVPLNKAKQKFVTLTIDGGPEDVEIRQNKGVPALRQHRMVRLCEEAFQQGGLLTLEDLSMLFNCGVRTLVSDLNELRKAKRTPPLRSTVKDMGRAITHRSQIITLWLQGNEYTDIAIKTHHSIKSVHNYVDKFKRSVSLFLADFEIHTISFLVNISPALVKEFHHIHSQCEPIFIRKQELEEYIKKNRLTHQSGRAQK